MSNNLDKWHLKICVEFALLFPEEEREEATDFVTSFNLFVRGAAREKRSKEAVIADLKRMYDDPSVIIPAPGFEAWRAILADTFSEGEPNRKRRGRAKEFALWHEYDFLIAAFEKHAPLMTVMEHLAGSFAEREANRKADRAAHQAKKARKAANIRAMEAARAAKGLKGPDPVPEPAPLPFPMPAPSPVPSVARRAVIVETVRRRTFTRPAQ